MLALGRGAFYRPASILAERFTPVWVVSIVGVIAATVWVGLLAYRNVDYSDDLWWTFAFNADAPRMLRAALVVERGRRGVAAAATCSARASRARDRASPRISSARAQSPSRNPTIRWRTPR